ncbi:MAG: TMEM143 family protein [Planctomycetota bacterium]
MSNTVDRILTSWSIDGTGPLTRSAADASTSGWIDPDAAHWSIESYLPIEKQTLVDYLLNRSAKQNELTPHQRLRFEDDIAKIAETLAQSTTEDQSHFAELYRSLDPDSDCKIPDELASDDGNADEDDSVEVNRGDADPQRIEGESKDDGTSLSHDAVLSPGSESRTDKLMSLFDRILTDAAYERLTQDDIEKCVGVASPWGVPMSADFTVFDRLAVYSRGDVIGKRCKRSLKKLYRNEVVDVAIYQRLVVLFQLSEDFEHGELLSADQFNLRIFKNIPKQDVDMLLPGTKVRIRKLDQAKFIVPSIGGWLFSLQKISRFVLVTLALAAYYSTALVIGLVLAAIGYAAKSFMGYFQTKNRYLLDLTKNLYFRKLDTNAGAGFQIIQQAARQLNCEATLAQYAVLSEAEPISRRRLRRKCERLIREAIDVEVHFRADRAVDVLMRAGLVRETADQKLVVSSRAPSDSSVSGLA